MGAIQNPLRATTAQLANNANQALASGLVNDVKRIAFVRPNALGDTIFSLPAIEALRAAYPQAEIVWLGRAWHQQLLLARTAVDRVIDVPPEYGPGPIANDVITPDSELFFAKMQAERFDIALQCYGGGRTANPFVRRLGARVSVGSRTVDAEGLDRSCSYQYLQPERVRQLEIAALVGAAPPPPLYAALEPRLKVLKSDTHAIEALLPEAYRSADRPLVVLHPGSTDARRRWPLASFAAVAQTLAKQGARFVVTGTAEETVLAQELTQRLTERQAVQALNLCGALSLPALIGLLARADLMLANDTGPLHLAHALGCRSVGIYWAFNFINSAPLTRQRHRPLAAWRMQCPQCGADCRQRSCDHTASFVDEIEPDTVTQASLALLNNTAQRLSAHAAG